MYDTIESDFLEGNINTDFSNFFESDKISSEDLDSTIEKWRSDIDMVLNFVDKHSLCVYIICDYGQVTENNINILKGASMYDSPENALFYTSGQNLFKQRSLVTCALDIKSCLDLLGIEAMRQLRKHYDQGVSSKALSKSISDNDLLNSFISKSNYKSIRSVFSSGKKVTPKSSALVDRYTQYKILDTSCLTFISEVHR